MTFKEETFWVMLKNCVLYAKQNRKTWVKKGIILEIFEDLEKTEKELDEVAQLQRDKDPGGFVEKKNLSIQNFVKRAYRLSCKLSLFARKTNNSVLLHDVDIAESTFVRESEISTLKLCSTIIAHGSEHLSQIEKYEVTKEEVDQLSVDLEELKKMPTEINLLSNERKSATREIKDLIVDTRDTLNDLDDAFEGMINDENFLEGWFEARKIKGRHNNKRQIDNEADAA